MLSMILHAGLLLVVALWSLWHGRDWPPAQDEKQSPREWEFSGVLLSEPEPPPQLIDIAPPAPVAPPTPVVVERPLASDGKVADASAPPQPARHDPIGTPERGRGLHAGQGSATGARRGGQGTTTFFQVPTEGRSVVYVIDRSASMGMEGRLELARRELLASLEALPPTARFQIIVYNSFAEPLRIDGRCELVLATEENKRLAAQRLASLLAEGRTEAAAALRRALTLQPEVIYFLTDADDLKADDVRAVTQLNRGRSVIHAIELNPFHRDQPGSVLQSLAHANRGVHQVVRTGSQ